MATSLNYTYNYAFQSGLYRLDKKPQLSLATCNLDHQQPYFFDGKMRHPRIIADMLLTLSDVVRTHYYLPIPPFTDPVLTSNEELLRVEGFSGCCGVYVRADLPAEMFDGDCHKRGTTNVDFNQPMRLALNKIRDQQDIQFSIGKSEVALTHEENKTIEKKVKMPIRWIKGFSEVQAYLPKLKLTMEVNAADALRFVRSLPKSSVPKKPIYVVSAGKGLRISHRALKGAVPILGTHRVKVIEPLLFKAKSLRIWCDEINGCSAWEVCYPIGSFFLMISPEIYRGFSGEGQILQDLAQKTDDKVLANIKAQLKWQSQISIENISHKTKISPTDVSNALSVMGSRGLVGFDAFSQHYYHRELPFEYDKVENLQPRLKNARKIIETGKIKQISIDNDSTTYQILGTSVNHRVNINNEQYTCTCPWFSKYHGKRGVCKHILAAQLYEELLRDKKT
jgi:hypothetical protein